VILCEKLLLLQAWSTASIQTKKKPIAVTANVFMNIISS